MKDSIGILGGMGPDATINLFQLLVDLADVSKDQDHVPLIVYNNPRIPDRTQSILHLGLSPLPFLLEGVRFLREADVSLILMPCVTAHYFYRELVDSLSIPFLHLIDESLEYISAKAPKLNRLGLLATDGTIAAGLYQQSFAKSQIEIMVPGQYQQSMIMEAVYGLQGIKAGFKGKGRNSLLKAVSHLQKKGAEAIIAGCTEIPLVLCPEDLAIPLYDPLKIIAEKALLYLGYPLKLS